MATWQRKQEIPSLTMGRAVAALAVVAALGLAGLAAGAWLQCCPIPLHLCTVASRSLGLMFMAFI